MRITKPKTEVNVEFRKTKTYCIKIKVNCADTINNCIDIKQYKYDCKYTSNDYGDYRKVTSYLDNYEYVGPNNGDYIFECSESGNLEVGNGDESNYLKVCGLESGDYQLYIKPKPGKVISPTKSDSYLQNVKLGNSDLSDFSITIINSD